MSPSKKSGLKKKALLIVGVVIFAGAGAKLLDLWHDLKAKKTVTEMVRLERALTVAELTDVDPESLEQLVSTSEVPLSLVDGWGRLFIVEKHMEEERVFFSVRSLGRDGRIGKCCQKWADDWDDDAVIAGGEWQQVWR